MSNTPGFIIPSSYSSVEELQNDLRRRDEAAGFTPFDASDFTGGVVEHHGIKGMHWGVRKDDHPGASKSVNNDARKDAHEFARAKQFYGEGAGNRRKLIKATVTGKSKKDATYKAAFDHHLANQNSADHAAKAKSERKRKDVKNSTAKTTRGVVHMLKGNPQYASAAAAMLVGGAMYAHKSGIDKVILNAGKTTIKKVRESQDMKKAADTLKGMGIG